MAKQSRHLLFDVSSAVESSYKVCFRSYELRIYEFSESLRDCVTRQSDVCKGGQWAIAPTRLRVVEAHTRERDSRGYAAMRALPSRHVPGLRDHSQCMRQLN